MDLSPNAAAFVLSRRHCLHPDVPGLSGSTEGQAHAAHGKHQGSSPQEV
jgi:hypothetical protein